MKISTNLKRITFSSIILIILLSLIFININTFYLNGQFNLILLLIAIFISVMSCILFSIKVETSKKQNLILNIISLIISVFFSYFIIELCNNTSPYHFFTLNTKRLLFNFTIILFLYLFIYFLSNSLSISIIISNIIIFILGTINYCIVCFRGTPLVPWDFLTIKTAAYVASNYTFKFNCFFLLAIIFFIMTIALALKNKSNYDFKTNFKLRSIFLIIIITITFTFYKTNIINFFNLETDLWEPSVEYSNNGFLASFVKQSKNLFFQKPQNYSSQEVKNIFNEINLQNAKSLNENNEKPNIIVIMNESFSDLRVNRIFQYL